MIVTKPRAQFAKRKTVWFFQLCRLFFFFCCSAQEFCFATFPPLDSKHRRIRQDDFLVETQQSAIWFFFFFQTHKWFPLTSSSPFIFHPVLQCFSTQSHELDAFLQICPTSVSLVEDATCSTRFSNPAYIVRLTPKPAKETLMCLRVLLILYTHVDTPAWLPCFPAREQI